jgi:hypothetical protein
LGIRRGGLTFTRYTVQGKAPKDLRQRYARAVRAHVLQPLTPEDEAMETSGWCALERPFDLEVNATKLFEGPVLLVGFRVDRWRVPSALLNAQLEDEETALLARSGKKRLSRTERAELKQKLKLRLRRKTAPATRAFDVCWDLDSGRLLFFTHSARVKESFTALFEKTFGLELAEDSPYLAARRGGLTPALERALEAVEPTSLLRPSRGAERTRAATATVEEARAEDAPPTESPDDDRDLVDRIETTRFLGSEFLLWLWLRTELVGGELSLTNLGKVEVWLDQQLTLCSPVDPKESVVIRGMAPADGAEAREAVRAQKLPVAGHVVMRTREGDFTFVLKGMDLAIASGRVPPAITDEGGDAFADRLERVQTLMTLLDRLFVRFLSERLTPLWPSAWEPAISAWLAQHAPSPAILQKLSGARTSRSGRQAR